MSNDRKKQNKILFLPYKASMWDSLESVWEAARDDENCHVVVMPIPYAVLNRDGSVKEWHCDKDMFPDYVPITDWHNYDLKIEHPDVIYIHNPYDDDNRLTRVEERFFSRNLRYFTDMLVYIPYFAVTGLWPENHLRLPCYEQVDKIIVQSSSYRAITDVFFEEDKVGIEDIMPKGNVVALGSPKLDKMAKVNALFKLPDDWMEKLGRRKTVFYNTTVAPLMVYGKRGIKKMWQVYHAMTKHPDMTFIWRPHPLLENMLEVQHPEVLADYYEWKKAMLSLPQVIYDDSIDLERSVALSDAYIGESSSVVQLFALSGKPIFYNDMLIGESDGESERRLIASGLHIEGERIYFWANYWNMLCELNMASGKIRILYQLPPSVFAVGNYSRIVKCGSHLIFSPGNARAILDYDLSDDNIIEIPIPNLLEFGNFSYGVVWENTVIMFGGKCRKIIAYDVAKKKVYTVMDTPVDVMKYRTSDHPYLWGKPCILGNVLYVPVINSNQVMSLNLEKMHYAIYYVGNTEAKYGFAEAYAGNIWLAPSMGGPIAVWNPPTGVVRVFDSFPVGFQYDNVIERNETVFFQSTVANGKYWWLMPYCANKVIRVNMENGNIDGIDLSQTAPQGYVSTYVNPQKVWCCTAVGDCIYLWGGLTRNIYCLDNESGKVNKIFSIELSPAEAAQYQHEISKEDFVEFLYNNQVPAVYEDGISRTHEAFFSYVKKGIHDHEEQKQVFRRLSANIDGDCGSKIHDYIMFELEKKRM